MEELDKRLSEAKPQLAEVIRSNVHIIEKINALNVTALDTAEKLTVLERIIITNGAEVKLYLDKEDKNLIPLLEFLF